MMNSDPISRRRAILGGAATAIGLSSFSPLRAAPAEERPDLGPLCIFAKPLQWLSFDAVGEFLKEIDADGIEATIRPGGQVEPEDAAEAIPRLVEALDKFGKQVTLFASNINAADVAHAESVLRTAAAHQIRYYRMGYYHYDVSRPILPQLDAFAKQMQSLVALNRELGMTALYQNHAGRNYFGGPLWDLQRLLSEMPKAQIATAFDIRHATAIGAASWPIQWRLMRPHTSAIYIKDFHWVNGKPVNLPLGEGQVDREFFRSLRDEPISGAPVSLHMEYVDHRKPELIRKSCEAIRRDRQTLASLLGI